MQLRATTEPSITSPDLRIEPRTVDCAIALATIIPNGSVKNILINYITLEFLNPFFTRQSFVFMKLSMYKKQDSYLSTILYFPVATLGVLGSIPRSSKKCYWVFL